MSKKKERLSIVSLQKYFRTLKKIFVCTVGKSTFSFLSGSSRTLCSSLKKSLFLQVSLNSYLSCLSKLDLLTWTEAGPSMSVFIFPGLLQIEGLPKNLSRSVSSVDSAADYVSKHSIFN